MQTVAMIVGRKTAPWEDRATAALLKPLGEVRDIVLRLLCRDPKRRMNMEQCFEALLPLLKESTQHTSSHSTSQSRSAFQEQLYRVGRNRTGGATGAEADGSTADMSAATSSTVR